MNYDKNLIEHIRSIVESECRKSTSQYGYDPYPFHFVPMVKYAEQLCDQHGGDKEIILIAAWLHDLGSIIHGREDHHITGAKIAEKKLLKLDYPVEKIELIKKCILNHRGSINNTRDSIEEKIIAEADVMSNFDNISGIFATAFLFENQTQGEAQISTREKLQRKWKQLHFESSRDIVRPKYEAAMLLLT